MSAAPPSGPIPPDPDIAARQRAVLAESPDDRDLERILDRHRAAMDDPGPEGGMPRVAVVALPDGEARRPVVAGEVLVPDAEAEDAAAVLGGDYTRLGLRGGCDVGVVRFAGPTSAEALSQALEGLRAAGVRAAPNHVASFSMRAKSGLSPDLCPDLPRRTGGAGEAAHVVVIDTGIAREVTRRDDGWLDGIVADPSNEDPLGAINRDENRLTGTGDPYLDDAAGHGTCVAGVIRQTAPGARITVLRALDSDGVGSEDQIACAIQAAGRLMPDVINLSLGLESLGGLPPLVLDAALRSLDPGIVVVAAAGNSPDEVPTWPAAFRRVVGVAGLTIDGDPARDWSKRGAWVNASAVATVASTFVAGEEDPQRVKPQPVDTWVPPSPSAWWTGTSFAAPRVAGLIAAGIGPATARESLADLLRRGTRHAGFGVALGV